MRRFDVFRAWGRILSGTQPTLSIEITRECPLRCPGCYAYEPEHLGNLGPLRSLADRQGRDLIDGILELVRRHRPVSLSLVGGEPLVRFRELDELLPRLSRMGLTVQLVTSAVRPIPASWSLIPRLYLMVSIDGLREDHDRRRAPATYDRILKNIQGHRITVHCTVTGQMARRPGSFGQFVSFWSAREEVRKIWFSLYTPQRGERSEEILTQAERAATLEQLAHLRSRFPKLFAPDPILEGYRKPPSSPDECLFARTTVSVTADLKGRITPCQFGGDPDCSQCGCLASAGMNSIGDVRLLGLPLREIYEASSRIGRGVSRWRSARSAPGPAQAGPASP
ncbi:MAG TPA: radical SAM protein [Candidatus Polarisedimenticolia bacterium]|nr:radical SAM protein [Candidatus Polarisedimenticolia bacterium]